MYNKQARLCSVRGISVVFTVGITGDTAVLLHQLHTQLVTRSTEMRSAYMVRCLAISRRSQEQSSG